MPEHQRKAVRRADVTHHFRLRDEYQLWKGKQSLMELTFAERSTHVQSPEQTRLIWIHREPATAAASNANPVASGEDLLVIRQLCSGGVGNSGYLPVAFFLSPNMGLSLALRNQVYLLFVPLTKHCHLFGALIWLMVSVYSPRLC